MILTKPYPILKRPVFDLENAPTPNALIETVEESENTNFMVSISLENSVCQIHLNKSTKQNELSKL